MWLVARTHYKNNGVCCYCYCCLCCPLVGYASFILRAQCVCVCVWVWACVCHFLGIYWIFGFIDRQLTGLQLSFSISPSLSVSVSWCWCWCKRNRSLSELRRVTLTLIHNLLKGKQGEFLSKTAFNLIQFSVVCFLLKLWRHCHWHFYEFIRFASLNMTLIYAANWNTLHPSPWSLIPHSLSLFMCLY